MITGRVMVKDLENTVYECLLGESSAKSAIVQTSIKNLSLLPSHIDLVGAEIEMAKLEKAIEDAKAKAAEVAENAEAKVEEVKAAAEDAEAKVEAVKEAAEGVKDALKNLSK